MRKGFWRVVASLLTILMVFQNSPGGMILAYAAEQGIFVAADGDELKAELASRSTDYPEGAFAFHEPSVALTEGDGDREVKVVRMGATDQAATVDVNVLNLTAENGSDYQVYVKEGGKKVYLEPATEEELAEAEEARAKASEEAAAAAEGAAAVEDASEDEAATSSLRAVYSSQTGKETVDTDWRGQSEQYLQEAAGDSGAAAEAANALVNALPGTGTTLSFEPGEYVKSIYIHVIDDDAAESEEAFKAVLGNASVGVLDEQLQLNVSIVDNEESEPVVFAMKDAEVVADEGATEAKVTVERTAGADYYAAAVVRTASASAASSDAYEALDGVQLAFAAGETEKTVSVPLTGAGEPGSYFKLMLDADAVNVDEGRDETVVWLGEKGDLSVNEPATADEPAAESAAIDEPAATDEPTAEAAEAGKPAPAEPVPAAEEPATDELADAAAEGVEGGAYATNGGSLASALSATTVNAGIALAAETVDGVVYDTAWVYEEAKHGEFKAYRRESVMLDKTATATRTFDLSQATRVRFGSTLGGAVKTLGKWRTEKNGSIYVNGTEVVNIHKEQRNDHWQENYVNLNYAQSKSGQVKLRSNTDGWNRQSSLKLTSIKAYYPRYTVNLKDAQQTLKGKLWTSTSRSTEFDVNALASGASWSTMAVRRGTTVSINPGTITQGVSVERYDIYLAGTNEKVGSIDSSLLDYSALNNLRERYDAQLRQNGYKIDVKPVYKSEGATVTFRSQDAAAIAFSGNKDGGTGFKVGDTLTCSQIDRITFTAVCPNEQEVKIASVTRSLRKVFLLATGFNNGYVTFTERDAGSSVLETFEPNTDAEKTSLTRTVEIDNAREALQVNHSNATITYEYTPEEATAANANAGGVFVYNAKDTKNPIGQTVVGKPYTLSGALSIMADTYLSQTVFGDGFEHFETELPTGGKASFTTRTLWTYRDRLTGQPKTVTGNALLFNPYYADETVNYHFKAIQDDETPAGVRGTVYVEEKPLFSANAGVTSKAAVGVDVMVGGYNAKTNSSGAYSIDAHFNKGEYVGAMVRYGTLSTVSDVAVSKDTVKDFHINVSESERLTVTDSKMYKPVSQGYKQEGYADVEKTEETASLLQEDKAYTFALQTKALVGTTGKSALFKFYDKNGNLRSEFTQTVPIDETGKVELKLNPMSVTCADGQKRKLEVGDFMTVTLVDTRGTEYFEHQTAVIVVEKLEGMYTFNYSGIKKEDDNAFVKALGGLSVGYDFALDLLSNEGGTYEDGEGNQHQLMYMGLGRSFKNRERVFQTMQDTIKRIDDITAGEVDVIGNNSALAFNNAAWSLDLALGIIMDTQVVKDGENKGKLTFEDYLLVADVAFGYSKEWEVSASVATFTFTLDFGVGDTAEGTYSGVKWHFYNATGKENIINFESNNAIELTQSDDYMSKGYFGLQPQIIGGAAVDLAGVAGVKGDLKVALTNNVSYDATRPEGKKTQDSGSVALTPKVYVRILGVDIPVWNKTWGWTWNTYDGAAQAQAAVARAASANLGAENFLYASIDAAKDADLSYTQGAGAWNGGTGGGFSVASLLNVFAAEPASAEAVEESVVKKGFLADSRINVADLGDGKYLAVFLDAVEGRADANAIAAYWSYYDGSTWSREKLLNDDGTTDQLPVVCDAGEAGKLVVWSSASKKFTGKEPLAERLSALDLQGVFFKDGKTSGDVMEITKTGKDGAAVNVLAGYDPGLDEGADTDPHAAVIEKDDGSTYLKLYYAKTEYEVTGAAAQANADDEASAEVLGDLLAPYSVIVSRTYDFKSGKWVEDYSGKLTQTIKDGIKTANPNYTDEQLNAAFEAYQKTWYGQEFLDLAPTVAINETLNDEGYWAAGTAATATATTSMDKSIAKDGDAVSYNGLALHAYALDKGGSGDAYDYNATHDQNLYMQIYNAEQDEYHHPILISGADAEISDIQFLRSSVPADESGAKTSEVTWLYWKEQVAQAGDDGEVAYVTSVKRLNITALVQGYDKVGEATSTLIKGKLDNGQEYYYINRADQSASDTVDGYQPPQVIATTTGAVSADSGDFVSIGNFQVRASEDGRYNYVMWSQFEPRELEDGDSKLESQLYVVREDTKTGEESLPVKVTDVEDQRIDHFDFAVTKDGNLHVLAGRVKLREATEKVDGKDVTTYEEDESTSELAFLKITPTDKMAVADVEAGDTVIDEDGDAEVELTATVDNQSFTQAKNLVVEAVDKSGKTVYTSKRTLESYVNTNPDVENADETPAEGGGVTLNPGTKETTTIDSFSLLGGESQDEAMTVPVAKDGSYDVTVRVKSGGDVLAEKQVKGTVAEQLSAAGVDVTSDERDHVELSATIANAGVLATSKHMGTFGYLDADGSEVKLGTVDVGAIEPGSSATVSADYDVDFADFESAKDDEGNLTDSRRFFFKLDSDDFEPAYGTLELTATAAQVALMGGMGKLGAGYFGYNTEDGSIVAKDGLAAGESSLIGLTVDGKLAETFDAYKGGVKVVWDEVESDVATVSAEGGIVAKKAGSVKLKGLVMPADTGALVDEDIGSVTVDNYGMLPSSLIKSVEATLTIGAGEGTGPGTDAGKDPGTDAGKDPGADAGTGNDAGKKGIIPQLGDSVDFMVVALALAGACLLAIGIRNARKHRKEI